VHAVTRPARALAVAALLAIGLAGAGAGPAPAGTGEARTPGRRLHLVAQTPWAPVDGNVTLGFTVPDSVGEGTELRLRVGPRVSSLDDFDEVVEEDAVRGRILSQAYVPFPDLLTDGERAYVSFGLGRTAEERRLAVSARGVYPLEVALVDGDVIASLLTWLVVTDPSQPVASRDATRLAMLWTVERAPVRGPDGTPDPDALAELAPGGRLSDIAALLDEATGIDLSVRLGPETVESWTALAAQDPTLEPGVTAVLRAAARRETQLLPSPYVPIDLTSLEAADLGVRLPDQIVLGSDTLERLTGVTPDPRTMLVDPVDARTLERLRGLFVDRVVVPASALDPSLPERTSPFELEVGSGTVRAAAASFTTDDLLGGAGSPTQRVQRATAALSLDAFDDESPSGVVVASPARWQPDVETVTAFLDAIRRHPLIEPVTLDRFFESVRVGSGHDEPSPHLAPHLPAPFPVTRAAHDTAAQNLASVRSSVGTADPGIRQGERALQLALSSDNSPEEAARLLSVVDAEVVELRDGVSTTRKRVTLTARRAAIPISFDNRTGEPVSVRVELASSKLLFPEGEARVVTLPEGNHTERFAVEARTSGTFTMTVTLRSQDGRLPIGPPTRLTVRSAVFSGAGAALTVGALVFLALWWANHFRRTRRSRRVAESS